MKGSTAITSCPNCGGKKAAHAMCESFLLFKDAILDVFGCVIIRMPNSMMIPPLLNQFHSCHSAESLLEFFAQLADSDQGKLPETNFRLCRIVARCEHFVMATEHSNLDELRMAMQGRFLNISGSRQKTSRHQFERARKPQALQTLLHDKWVHLQAKDREGYERIQMQMLLAEILRFYAAGDPPSDAPGNAVPHLHLVGAA